MKKRSGLADSPFFAPADATEAVSTGAKAGVSPTPVAHPTPESTPISHHDSMMARQHDGTVEPASATMTARQHDSMTADFPTYLRDCLHYKANQKITIRLPAEVIDDLEETLYLLKTRHHAKLSMNAIFIAALAYFCWDFHHHGTASTLYTALTEKSR